MITSTKLYVPVFTLPINDNIKFLENIKQGFKKAIFWNKYRFEITTHAKNNNLDYLIDPTLRNINRLFVLSLKNVNDDPTRGPFDECYASLVEIEYFNALLDEHIYNTEVLKSNLCDFGYACILVKGDITVIGPATQVSFRKCGPFTKCITKIDGTIIGDAEDLDLVMPIYNLVEYSSDYSETAESLWFYSKDQGTNVNNNIENTVSFKSFMYKAKFLGNTVAQPAPNNANGILKNATIAVPLKYLSNFWRSREMPLINCKIELKLEWTKYCVLSSARNDNTNANPNNIIFTIKDTNLFSCRHFISKR